MTAGITVVLLLIAKGAGGYLAGLYRPGWSLTRLGDIGLGMIGAKLGSQLWSMIGIAAGNSVELSLWGIGGSIVAGFIGGLTLLAIVFQFRQIFSK